jgi:hypothetical protein
MMREVPHLGRIQPGAWLYRPAVHGIVDKDESQISQEKAGESRRPVFHPCGPNIIGHRAALVPLVLTLVTLWGAW